MNKRLINGLRKAGRSPLAKAGGIEIWWEQVDGIWNIYLGSSDSLRDVWRSLQALPIKGYHRGYTKAAPEVAKALPQALLRPGEAAILHGHSLGGAVALRLSQWLTWRHGTEVLKVVTVGAPKVARPWVCRPMIPHERYVCGDDPFPSWPPCYEHQTKAIKLPSPNLDKPRLVRGFFDHRLTSYEDSFEQATTTTPPLCPNN